MTKLLMMVIKTMLQKMFIVMNTLMMTGLLRIPLMSVRMMLLLTMIMRVGVVGMHSLNNPAIESGNHLIMGDSTTVNIPNTF